jgi:hypothetical protein
MISDDDIEAALDFLRDNAERAGKAIADAELVREYRKVKKAELMGLCNEGSAVAQERFAYAHPDYAAHLEVMRTAITRAETARFLMKEKDARIDAWRTQQSNQRSMGKIV